MSELEKIANQLDFEQPMNPEPLPVPDEEDVARAQAEGQEDVEQEGYPEDEEAIRAEIAGQEEQALAEEEALAEEQAIAEEQALAEEQAVAEEQASAEEEQAMVEGQALAEQDAAAEIAATETLLAEEDVEGSIQNRNELEGEVIENVIGNMSNEDLEDVLVSKVASEMQSLGTIAKIIEFANGDADYITAEMQKEASELIDYMVSSEDAFFEGMERVASELFESEESQQELYSREGLAFTFEQLAAFDSIGFDKQANEELNALQKLKAFAGNAVNSGREAVNNAVYSTRNTPAIGEELAGIRAEEAEYYKPENHNVGPQSLEQDAANRKYLGELAERKKILASQKNLGNGIRYGTAGAVAAGGAIYGGKKIYDHMNRDQMEEKVAGVLPVAYHGDTLNVATETENNGGIQKMSKQLVNDFLKVAGAAGLVSITNDESLDMELRKEASDAFDYISNLGSTDMDNELVKVAQEIYSEDELHEIVAGGHTDYLMDKVAFFIEATESSFDELEKIASAGGVSAIKSMGGKLRDASSNIINTIGAKKDQAQGAAREYAGVLKDHKGSAALSHGATGLAGGGLVAGGLAGYNAINNPEEYDIEQTAAALEEAYLTKQAAVEAFGNADRFIRDYGHILNN